MPKQEQSTDPAGFKNRAIQGVRLRTSWPQVSLPSDLVLPSQFLWPVASVVYLCCREENRRKGPTLCLVEPLPDLLAALATLFVR